MAATTTVKDQHRLTLEQQRAQDAWNRCERYTNDHVNLAKGLPALIMNSGLMQVLAFLHEKGQKESQRYCEDVAGHLRAWLQGRFPRVIQNAGFETFMQSLMNTSSRDYQAITAERLSLGSSGCGRWLRRARGGSDMPIAAVPNYLGRDFHEASPAVRFGMYLPIWTERADQEAEIRDRASRKSRAAEELQDHLKRHGMDATIAAWVRRQPNPLPGLWAKNDHAGRKAWSNVAKLGDHERKLMAALLERQRAAATVQENAGNLMHFEARAVAPFTTGLGNEHPLENGFAFLNPYGLPYLPGSGVKGVLRQAAWELARGEWNDARGWSEEQSYPLLVGGKPVLDSKTQPVMLSMLDVLFGRDKPSGESDHLRGALCFWDVIPQIKGDSLLVEIMTPHQGHYYQWKKDQRGNEIEVAPHESGSPNPISFLTVPPGSRFVFHVQCDLALLGRHAPPDLAKDERWKELLSAAFEHAFRWLGFGAKTAVGYGAMTPGDAAGSEPAPPPVSGKQRRGTTLTGKEERWDGATLKWEPGPSRLTAVAAGKKPASLQGERAKAFLQLLPEDQRERLLKKRELKPASIIVEVLGNQTTPIAPAGERT